MLNVVLDDCFIYNIRMNISCIKLLDKQQNTYKNGKRKIWTCKPSTSFNQQTQGRFDRYLLVL